MRQRWFGDGESGLIDRREDNGDAKVSESYIATVRWILLSPPTDFLHRRPTWTRELLIDTAQLYTEATVSVTTMGRVLATLGARRGRAKPIAACPWSPRRKGRRLALIRSLVDSLPKDEACVWEDEVDIDLNPRIGVDWMLPGHQRQVPTPGVKRYLAGAMDARSRLHHKLEGSWKGALPQCSMPEQTGFGFAVCSESRLGSSLWMGSCTRVPNSSGPSGHRLDRKVARVIRATSGLVLNG